MLVLHGNAILFSLLEFWFINAVATALDVLCLFQGNFLYKSMIIFFKRKRQKGKKGEKNPSQCPCDYY